ncbi:MAG: hypothetical protein RMJ06_06795 [Nitrososphaerota archaeon]|nr:hypothetical protein [Nitrososphaerota archaeon]
MPRGVVVAILLLLTATFLVAVASSPDSESSPEPLPPQPLPDPIEETPEEEPLWLRRTVTISTTEGGTAACTLCFWHCDSFNVGEASSKTVRTYYGAVLRCKAEASEGYVFKGWSGTYSFNSPEFKVVVLKDISMTAEFERLKHEVKFKYDGSAVAPEVCYVTSSGEEGCGKAPFSVLVAHGDKIDYTYEEEMTSGGYRYSLVSVSPEPPVLVEDDLTVIGRYEAQAIEHKVTFDFEGSPVAPNVCYTLDGVHECKVAPFTITVAHGSELSFEYEEEMTSGGYRYSLVSVTPSSPYIVTHDVTVVGRYWGEKIRYQVDFNYEGAGIAPEVCYTLNGVHECRTAPFSIFVEHGSELSFEYESEVVGEGTKYVLDEATPSPIVVESPLSVIGKYHTEHYLVVESKYGTPSLSSGWYREGSELSVSVDPMIQEGRTRHVCLGFEGYGSVPSSGNVCSVSFVMDKPSGVTFLWADEFLVEFKANTRAEVKINGRDYTTGVSFWARPGTQFSFDFKKLQFDGSWWALLTSVSHDSPIRVSGPTKVYAKYLLLPLIVTPTTVTQGEHVKLYMIYVGDPGALIKVRLDTELRIVSAKLYGDLDMPYLGAVIPKWFVGDLRTGREFEFRVPWSSIALVEVVLIPEKAGVLPLHVSMNGITAELNYHVVGR